MLYARNLLLCFFKKQIICLPFFIQASLIGDAIHINSSVTLLLILVLQLSADIAINGLPFVDTEKEKVKKTILYCNDANLLDGQT